MHQRRVVPDTTARTEATILPATDNANPVIATTTAITTAVVGVTTTADMVVMEAVVAEVVATLVAEAMVAVVVDLRRLKSSDTFLQIIK